MLELQFEFHPVGQGLFYSGIFRHHKSNNQFSFVYDCGTESSRQYILDEIDELSNQLYEKLDLLIISHLHSDHTNEIKTLLKKTKGARIAILPYLTPEEKLIATADCHMQDGNQDLLALIKDPRSFLNQNKVDKIIFIHPDDDEKRFDEENVPPFEPDNLIKENFQFEETVLLKRNDAFQSSTTELHCFDSGSINLSRFWEFKFFNKNRDQDKIDNFKQLVGDLLKNPDFNIDDLTDYITRNPNDFRDEFKKIYEDAFDGKRLINDTSLVVYHNIVNILNLTNIRQGFYTKYPHLCFRRLKIGKSGTLLTGDIIINKDCIKMMSKKWSGSINFNDVKAFQVPHHGSYNNTFKDMFIKFPYVKCWIINFGLGNKYKHPAQSVINMININSNGRICLNTQIYPVDYRFVLFI